MNFKPKRFLRAMARIAGLEVQPFRAHADQYLQIRHAISKWDVHLVCDVGANTGQFGVMMRRNGYRGDILSFEPLANAHAALKHTAAADPNWTIGPRVAIGDRNGEATINVAANSQSSSLLPMLGAHEQAAPKSRYVGNEKVSVRRLDELIVANPACRILLKIDTQGYEDRVLRGAEGVFDQIQIIYIEMSLTPLYEGELGFRELYDFICGMGFRNIALHPGFTDPMTYEMLQVDGIFVRDAV